MKINKIQMIVILGLCLVLLPAGCKAEEVVGLEGEEQLTMDYNGMAEEEEKFVEDGEDTRTPLDMMPPDAEAEYQVAEKPSVQLPIQSKYTCALGKLCWRGYGRVCRCRVGRCIRYWGERYFYCRRL